MLISFTVAPSISIHAPAKGATVTTVSLYHVKVDFNPRSREGSDKTIKLQLIDRLLFQSTLPRRERPFVKSYDSKYINNFNPRSREGSDKPGKRKWKPLSYFNPRSREGSDDVLSWFTISIPISIHAPAKGATVPG